MHSPAQLQRGPQVPVAPALPASRPISKCRRAAALAAQCRLRQADGHGGCTLRHAHLERRLPHAQAVAEPQQIDADVFQDQGRLQQPGMHQQQVRRPGYWLAPV